MTDSLDTKNIMVSPSEHESWSHHSYQGMFYFWKKVFPFLFSKSDEIKIMIIIINQSHSFQMIIQVDCLPEVTPLGRMRSQNLIPIF